MAEFLQPEICVIGAGSGGLTVAAVCAAFGVSCVLIERGRMGGDCLNYGCVPSKALLAAAHRAHDVRTASLFGLKVNAPTIDYARVQAHVEGVIAAIAPNDSEARFTAMGVHVIRAEARFIDRRTVEAGGQKIRASRFVIATGSSPRVPPIEGLEDVPYLTNETIFELKVRPSHLIIMGGGPIGMEMAQAYVRLGAKVTVIEAVKALGKDDPEAAAIVKEHIIREGVRLIEGAKVSKVIAEGDAITVTASGDEGDEAITGSHLLVAIGRQPNLSSLDLDAAGIVHDERGIKVSAGLKTSNRAVYAIGDVAGGMQFTHVANYHAGLVIQNALFGLPAREKRQHVPWVTYTDPELAHVGLTEAEAHERHGRELRILRWPYAENDRAQAEHQTSGFIKVMTDRKGHILGVTIVGALAGEMINMWSLAMAQGLKISAMRGFISPYPTRMEISKRAAITFYSDFPRSGTGQRLLKLGRFLRRLT